MLPCLKHQKRIVCISKKLSLAISNFSLGSEQNLLVKRPNSIHLDFRMEYQPV
jgi:hypothetical protein